MLHTHKIFWVLLMRKKFNLSIRKVFIISFLTVLIWALLIYPQNIAEGVRNGLTILGRDLIPSLFPFMILSSYIGTYTLPKRLCSVAQKITMPVFKTSGYSVIPFILGALGGYPVGAKTVYELLKKGDIPPNEAERLMYWCINPSPAFCISALGVFILGNPKTGIIIYFSCLLASVTTGFLCRFLTAEINSPFICSKPEQKPQNKLTFAVSSGTESMLCICGWVLAFAGLCELWNALLPDGDAKLFLQSVGEVMTGCRFAAENNLPLPAISALVSFGGFAVICQCSTYASYCGIKLKHLICSRLINCSLASVFTYVSMQLFPYNCDVYTSITAGNTTFTLYHSISAGIILIAMCTLFILEVDNKRKIC